MPAINGDKLFLHNMNSNNKGAQKTQQYVEWQVLNQMDIIYWINQTLRLTTLAFRLWVFLVYDECSYREEEE